MTIHPWKDKCGNLGNGIPEMKGPDNVVDDSLTVFTLPLPCTLLTSLQRMFSELWLPGPQAAERQSGLSHRSPSSPGCKAQSPQGGHSEDLRERTRWAGGAPAGWVGDGLLKREAGGGGSAGPAAAVFCWQLSLSPPGLLQRAQPGQMSARFPGGQESSPLGAGGEWL